MSFSQRSEERQPSCYHVINIYPHYPHGKLERTINKITCIISIKLQYLTSAHHNNYVNPRKVNKLPFTELKSREYHC